MVLPFLSLQPRFLRGYLANTYLSRCRADCCDEIWRSLYKRLQIKCWYCHASIAMQSVGSLSSEQTCIWKTKLSPVPKYLEEIFHPSEQKQPKTCLPPSLITRMLGPDFALCLQIHMKQAQEQYQEERDIHSQWEGLLILLPESILVCR